MKKHIILIGILVSAVVSYALPSRPSGFVSDNARILSVTVRDRLEDLLVRTERASGIEIAVSVVPSMDGRPIEDFGQALFDAWGIGKKGKDNGLLILLAVSERKVRIVTGYGLEESLPDGLCGDILEQEFLPAARGGDFDRAFVLTVSRVVSHLQRYYGFTVEGFTPADHPAPGRSVLSTIVLVLLVLFLVFGRGLFPWLFPFLLGRAFGGGFGGGFSGGGGFGGFGGGFSGGGGAGRSF